MTSIETISIVIAAVSVVIGVINSIRSNQKAEEQRQTEIQTRQAELFMQMYRDWSAPEFRKAVIDMSYHHSWEDFAEFNEKYGSLTNTDEWVNTYIRQATLYEGIGVLVEQGLIDIELVDRLLHNTTIYFWEKMGPIFSEYRKKQPSDHQPYYDSTEYLYNQIKNRAKDQEATVTASLR
jgi:hypothetical protein